MASANFTITPQDVRDFANLPSEVPNTLLQKHIAIAARDLAAIIGDDVDASHQADVSDALCNRALASAFPWLHTFSLSGAAKVGRMEGSVEYKFLDADETSAAVDDLTSRFETLAARINAAQEQQDDDGDAGFGSISMIAI